MLPVRCPVVLATAAVLALGGCATFRSYDAELQQALHAAQSGRLEAAIKTLDRINRGDDKDLLYHLEMGELQRLAGHYQHSQKAWRAADREVRRWEAAAALDPERVSGSVASYLVNDKLRPYEGQDYEKVMLTTRMALNFLAQADFANARVAIKQTHEREALIAELRSRQYGQVEEEARKRGADTDVRDLSGYPVASIDTPEVRALRNSYQSAFSHYLAGFVYEALGEPSLAAPGYRQAIELHGGDAPLLDEALAGLDQRAAGTDDGMSDVLFAIETGLVPARVSRRFGLPIPIDEQLVLVAVSFPVLAVRSPGAAAARVALDGQELPSVQITSVDAMARRALHDEMPGIILRAFVRSTAKAVVQYQAQRQAEEQRRQGDETSADALEVAALGLMLGSVATESADERGWRSLPANIHVARTRVPPGSHAVSVDTGSGPQTIALDIAGRHVFVHLRALGSQLLVASSAAGGGRRPPGPPLQSTDSRRPLPAPYATAKEAPPS
jgi:hypothetical protein